MPEYTTLERMKDEANAQAKYIFFAVAVEGFGGRSMFWIANKKFGDYIGQVFWYSPWRRWCCRFKEESVWSGDCLADVGAFLKRLNKEARDAKA